MTDSLAPAIIPILPELNLSAPALQDIVTNDNPPLEQVKKSDMQQLNFELAFLNASWDKIETIRDGLVLIREHRDLRKDRRALLGLPYGSTQNNSSKVVTWEPLP